MDEDTKKFWQNSSELTAKGRFIRFTDENKIEVDISDWTIHQVDTNWGRKPCLKSDDDEFLKVESKRLRFLLSEFSGKKCRLGIIRHDSEPNPLETWWEVEELPVRKQSKLHK